MRYEERAETHFLQTKRKVWGFGTIMFTNKQLRKLVVPLVLEQLLSVTIGMADTMMVASCGEAAVSGISLVDTISVLLIGLFSAMASGGAVTVAQYIGKGDGDKVSRASNQLFMSVTALSIVFMAVALIGNRQILSVIYGRIDADVMRSAQIYFYYNAVSFPFLGIYNSGAALFRAVGNSKVSMQVSLFSNILNVAGNALLIYGAGMGVAGAALSTLISRVLSAGVICFMLMRKGDVPVSKKIGLDRPILNKILYIGIPSGLENSIFQVGKILLSSLTASFGTAAITANAVTGSVGNFQLIPAGAIGTAIVTVVGQCVGAGEYKQARRYMFKLLWTAYLFVTIIGIGLIVFREPIFTMYNLSEETTRLTEKLLLYHCVCCMLMHPMSFALPNGLRAAGDVRFTMIVAIASMWICRLGLAYFLAKGLNMGVFGIYVAMTADWLVRGICFLVRVLTGKWEKYMGVLTKE